MTKREALSGNTSRSELRAFESHILNNSILSDNDDGPCCDWCDRRETSLIDHINIRKEDLIFQWIENSGDTSFNYNASRSESNLYLFILINFCFSFKIFNEYTKYLGVMNADYQFVEVIEFDENLLTYISQPILAVIVIFPVTDEVSFLDMKMEF